MPEIVGRLRTPRLASAPSSPVVGEMYYNTASNKLFWWNGTAWVESGGGAGGAGFDVFEQPNDPVATATVGDLWIDTDEPDSAPAVGPPGPAGADGPPGAPGPPSMYVGTGTPPGAQEIWIDTDEPSQPAAYVPSYVTALPSSPTDGQEVYFQSAAMATDGIVWHLRYRSGSASAYKWELVGGSDVEHYVAAAEVTTSASYVDVGAGPTLTLPLAGDYDVLLTFWGWGAAASYYYASVKIGAATTVENDAIQFWGDVGAEVDQRTRLMRRTIATAGTVLKVQYKSGSGNFTFSARQLRARPVRVG